MSGYIVVYRGIDGRPVELRDFTFGIMESCPDAEARRAFKSSVKREARAYRDGVAEGIFRASFILNELVGAGS